MEKTAATHTLWNVSAVEKKLSSLAQYELDLQSNNFLWLCNHHETTPRTDLPGTLVGQFSLVGQFAELFPCALIGIAEALKTFYSHVLRSCSR